MPSREELHELLTPLAVMKGAISIVLKHGDRLDPEVRDRWLQLAIEQSDQLNAVMNELRASEAEAQAAAEVEAKAAAEAATQALADATDRRSIRVEIPSSRSRELVE